MTATRQKLEMWTTVSRDGRGSKNPADWHLWSDFDDAAENAESGNHQMVRVVVEVHVVSDPLEVTDAQKIHDLWDGGAA